MNQSITVVAPVTPTDEIGGIVINPNRPTALPGFAPTGEISALTGDVLCAVINGNNVSNVAVRREPNTSSQLFYAIQPTYTASVLEIRSVPGDLPWFRVRVDNPILTDLDEVIGWLRSDTVTQLTNCPF